MQSSIKFVYELNDLRGTLSTLQQTCNGNFWYLEYFQIGGISTSFEEFTDNVEQIRIMVNPKSNEGK